MLKKMIMFLLIITTTFLQAQEKINIPGFGGVDYIKNEKSFTINLDKIGKLNLKGTINPLSLETAIKMEQLKRTKAYKILSKLKLKDLKIKLSKEGLFLQANANTGGVLKRLFKALKITQPNIQINVLIAKDAFALSGALDFTKSPIIINIAPKLGTRITLEGIEIGANVGIEYPGKEKNAKEKQVHEANVKQSKKKSKKKNKGNLEFNSSIYVTTTMRIRPTKSDPDLKIITEFEYDLVSQEITGAGSMVDTWTNPLGLSKILPKNSISMTNTAMEIGWIPGSPTPTSIGFYIEKGKFFHLEFSFGLSIAPANASIALMAKRNKMTLNDFTQILREGFKLKVPDVFPKDIYIENAELLFSPKGGKVGEFEIEQGFALKGHVKFLNAMDAKLDFRMNNDLGFYLDLKMKANFKEAMMKEIRKIKVLAPIMNRVLSTFEVRKVNLHLEASKKLVFSGKTNCHFKVLGKDIKFAFEGKFDLEAIKQRLIERIEEIAGPEAVAAIQAVTKGVKQASKLANSVVGISGNLVKMYVTLGKTKSKHLHLRKGGEKYCRRVCIPNRANEMSGKVLYNSLSSITIFHDTIIEDLVKIQGETQAETRKLRENLFLKKWNELNKKIEEDWTKIYKDKLYVGFFVSPKAAAAGGKQYRRLLDKKKVEYTRLKNKLYKSLIYSTAPSLYSYNKIRNSWKNTYLNIEKGLRSSKIEPGWYSAMWRFEPVEGTKYVRIKNRWKNTYLHIEGGKQVQCSKIKPGWHSAQWEILREGNIVRIKNRWKKTYLNIERGKLQCTDIKPGWESAKWKLDDALVVPITIKYNKSAGCGSLYKNAVYLKKHCGWLKTWDTILRIGCTKQNFEDKFMFYDKKAGFAEIFKIDGNGNMKRLKKYNNFRTDWSNISWQASDICKGLIKFEKDDGYWEEYKSDDKGNLILHSKEQ